METKFRIENLIRSNMEWMTLKNVASEKAAYAYLEYVKIENPIQTLRIIKITSEVIYKVD